MTTFIRILIIEAGDLNIITDPGNPSDGLRYLDMTFSVAKTQAAALTAAQAVYANARLATPAEFDDLFDAAGITYDGSETASDAFTIGGTLNISSNSGGTYDNGVLQGKLGPTLGTTETWIWSDPDGSTNITGTRDYLRLEGNVATIRQSTGQPPLGQLGWMIVSEVPIPGAVWLLGSGLLGLLCLRRKLKS